MDRWAPSRGIVPTEGFALGVRLVARAVARHPGLGSPNTSAVEARHRRAAAPRVRRQAGLDRRSAAGTPRPSSPARTRPAAAAGPDGPAARRRGHDARRRRRRARADRSARAVRAPEISIDRPGCLGWSDGGEARILGRGIDGAPRDRGAEIGAARRTSQTPAQGAPLLQRHEDAIGAQPSADRRQQAAARARNATRSPIARSSAARRAAAP